MRSKVSSDWLPSFFKATRPVLEIFKMAGYFPDSPRMYFEIRHRNFVPVYYVCSHLTCTFHPYSWLYYFSTLCEEYK